MNEIRHTWMNHVSNTRVHPHRTRLRERDTPLRAMNKLCHNKWMKYVTYGPVTSCTHWRIPSEKEKEKKKKRKRKREKEKEIHHCTRSMSHVTTNEWNTSHTNESRLTYIPSEKEKEIHNFARWMSHVATNEWNTSHMNESRLSHTGVPIYRGDPLWKRKRDTPLRAMGESSIQDNARNMSYVNESCHTRTGVPTSFYL